MTINSTSPTGVSSVPRATGPVASGGAPAEEALPEALPYLTEVPRAQSGPNAAEVRALQRLLKAAGFDPGPVDGWFGPVTARAVRAFQQARGLTVDAEVGPQTWGAMGLKGAPRPGVRPSGPASGPNQASGLGLPPLPTGPGTAPASGSPHDRRHAWFLSQQPTAAFNPNEDVAGNGNCGPSSVTMIARPFGMLDITAAQVDAANEDTRRRMGESADEKKGTSFAGIERGLESYGLNAEVKGAPNYIEAIQAELARGRLVIAHVRATYLRPNATTGHYTVVTKIENGQVYLNDSSNKGGPIVISVDAFMAGVRARGTFAYVTAWP